MADVTFHQDVQCKSDGGGIVVGADGITIDLNGHTLSGTSGVDDGVGIHVPGHQGVTIQGGTVQGFDTNILLEGPHGKLPDILTGPGDEVPRSLDEIAASPDQTGHNTILNMIVRGAVASPTNPHTKGYGILVVGSSFNLIERNLVELNGGDESTLHAGIGIMGYPGGKDAESAGMAISNIVRENTVVGNSSRRETVLHELGADPFRMVGTDPDPDCPEDVKVTVPPENLPSEDVPMDLEDLPLEKVPTTSAYVCDPRVLAGHDSENVENHTEGILVGPGVVDTLVEGNQVSANALDGIAVSLFPSPNAVFGPIKFSEEGSTTTTLFMGPSLRTVIRGNTVLHNGLHFQSNRPGDGIHIESSADTIVEGNTVCGNGGNGIFAGPGANNLLRNNNVGPGTGSCAPNAQRGVAKTYDLHDSSSDRGLPPCAGNRWEANYTGNSRNSSEPQDSVNHECTRANSDSDLSISMQFNEGTPSPVEEGDQIIYDVSVQNTGPNRADLTQVTHSLQGSLGFVSSQWDPPRPGDPQPCSPAQAKVSCSLGTLAKDQTAGYKLTLSALRAGNASNRAEVVASQPDPTSSNDSAEVQTQVNAGPVSAIVSTLTASPATAVANGTSSSTVTATLKDASGDPVSGKAVTLSKATGPGTLNISAASAGSDNTNSAGQASFKVTTTTAGTYSVKAETGSVVLSQKPAIRFDPGPVSATVSTLTANPASLAVNTATKATATLKDASGNPVPAKTVSLAKATGPGTLSISPFSTGSATTNSLGQATFLVKTTTAGAYTLKAQTGAVVLSQKPAVRFNPGPVSAAASTVAAAPAAVSANGTSASKLTVTLRDAFSNPVPAKQVSMSKLTGPPTPAGSLSVTCNPCTTNTAGQVVFSVKSTVAGVYSFRAKDTTDNIVLTEPQDVVQVSFWADENNPAVSYRWQTASASSALGGSYIQDRLPGSSASFRFTGTSITWYTAKGPSMGQAELWVDGVRKQTVDLYAPSNVFKHPGYTQTGLTNAPHTIKIVVKGTKSSASKDTLVPIDGFKVGTTTVATPAAPALSTVWARVPNSSSSSGAYARANLGSPTDTATFAFTGKSVAWHSVRGPDQGRARVYIDGVLKQTVDNYAPSHSFNTQVYKTDLSPGSHSIKIEVLGTKHASSTGTNIAVDRFVVS